MSLLQVCGMNFESSNGSVLTYPVNHGNQISDYVWKLWHSSQTHHTHSHSAHLTKYMVLVTLCRPMLQGIADSRSFAILASIFSLAWSGWVHGWLHEIRSMPNKQCFSEHFQRGRLNVANGCLRYFNKNVPLPTFQFANLYRYSTFGKLNAESS